MRNLSRISNYANKIEAWKDWNNLADQVEKAGYDYLLGNFWPNANAGWRKIDKQTALLREVFQGILWNDGKL